MFRPKLRKKKEQAERERDEAVTEAKTQVAKRYQAERENAELIRQNEDYDQLGLEVLELKRERDKYKDFLLHLYGNQQDLDDILSKFEAMKGADK